MRKTPDDCHFCIFGLSHHDGMMIRSEQYLSTEYNAGFSQVENDIGQKTHATSLIRYIKETVIRPFRTTGISLGTVCRTKLCSAGETGKLIRQNDALAHGNVFRLD